MHRLGTCATCGSLFDAGTAGGLTDRQLLECFAAGRDPSAEAAFEALVLRHGPMVMRVCRGTLGDLSDSHDAFQATFLVLVQRCRSIRRLDSVGSWLFGVASRVARQARLQAACAGASPSEKAVCESRQPSIGMMVLKSDWTSGNSCKPRSSGCQTTFGRLLSCATGRA